MSRPAAAFEIPAGFVQADSRGPFTTHNGPIYLSAVAAGAAQAFHAERRHCNGMGLIHGGMLSAFLDGLLAAAAARETEAIPVTIHLSVDYLGMGRAGDWVVGEARLTRATGELAFAEGRAGVGPRDLARATAVFKLMRRTRRPG